MDAPSKKWASRTPLILALAFAPIAQADDGTQGSPQVESLAQEKETELQVKDYVDSEFRNDTETRSRAVRQQRRIVADRMETVLSDFIEIGGYVRAGYGRDTRGGPLVGFRAPGAVTKYRLGNEAEDYAELILGKNVYLPGIFHMDSQLRPDGTPTGPIARVQLRLSLYNPYGENTTRVGLPEAYASIANVIPHNPTAKFWAGNRFYRRHDIHINDFFFWNMSGSGGGVEDVAFGSAKLAVAWIGSASNSGLTYVPQPDPANQAGFTKSSLDMRLYDLPLLGGTLEAGIIYSRADSGRDQSGREQPPSSGVAVHLVHTLTGFLREDGTHKLSLQYGTGPAKTFTSDFATTSVDGSVYIVPDASGSWRFRFTESFMVSLHDWFSCSPVVVVQATREAPGTDAQVWLSGGFRPIVHFTRYFNLAVEGGLDWVRDPVQQTKGHLFKLTFAPEVSVDRAFSSRPAVRMFATYAQWSDGFRGQVGGVDYADRRSGVTWGMQMEAWW